MKIIRDGKEYELTSDELALAYYEERMNRDINNIKFILKKKNKWTDLIQRMNEDKIFAEKFAKQYRKNKDASMFEEEWSCFMTAYEYYQGKLKI